MDPFRQFASNFINDFISSPSAPRTTNRGVRIPIHSGPLPSAVYAQYPTGPIVEEVPEEEDEDLHLQEAMRQSIIEEEKRKQQQMKPIVIPDDTDMMEVEHDEEEETRQLLEAIKQSKQEQLRHHNRRLPPSTPPSTPLEEDDSAAIQRAIEQSTKSHLESQRSKPVVIDDDQELQEAIRQSMNTHSPRPQQPKPQIVQEVHYEDDNQFVDEAEFEEALRQSMAPSKPAEIPIDNAHDDDQEIEEAIRQSIATTNQSLRQEQDKEFLESLQRDQERERQQAQEIEKQEEEFNNQEEKDAIELSIELTKKRRQEELGKSLPKEPAQGEPNTTHLVVRLPDGNRLERRFYNKDKLELLKRLIQSKQMEMGLPEKYRIVQPFPKKVFENMNESFEEAGLGGRAVVVIESL